MPENFESKFGQLSQEKTPEAKEKREELNNKEKQRREKRVDWFLLSSVADLIKKYINIKSKDTYVSDVLGANGDWVLYETTGDNLPEELMAAKEKGMLDLIMDGEVWKFVLSVEVQKSYENYIKIKESWGKEKEQGVE